MGEHIRSGLATANAPTPETDAKPPTITQRIQHSDWRYDLPVLVGRRGITRYIRETLGLPMAPKMIADALHRKELRRAMVGRRFDCSPRDVDEWIASLYNKSKREQ